MKKIYLTLLAAVATLAAMAQAPVGSDWAKKTAPLMEQAGEQTRCDSIVQRSYDGSPMQRIVNHYGDGGLLVERVLEVYEGITASYVASERYQFGYDSHGNVCSSDYAKWNPALAEWQNQQRVEEDYDAKGLKTSQRNYTWQDGEWVLASRGDATYDAQGNQLTNVVKNYNSFIQGWTKSKNEYTYNEQNLCTSATYFGTVEDTEEFVPSFRTLYSYAADGQMTEMLTQDWDPAQQKFTDTSKEEWTYDEAGNQTVFFSYYKDYNTGELAATSKHEMEYDGRGNMLAALFYGKGTDGEWTLQNKEEYTYNAMDSVLTKTTYSVPFGGGELKADVYWQYEYDEAGNCTLFLTQYMGADGQWVNMTKDEKAYDGAGLMTSQKKYNWSMAAGAADYQWQLTFQGDYAYDGAGRMLSIEERSYDMMQGRWMGVQKSVTEYAADGNILKETVYQWVDATQEFAVAGTINYYYSTPTGIAGLEAGAEGFSITAANGCMSVTFGGTSQPVAVYSLSGQKVADGPVATGLTPGQVYVVAVGNRYSCKFVAR